MEFRFLTILMLNIFLATSYLNAVPVNIAQGKSYSFSWSPNYTLCTDSGDSTQLTDGSIYTGSANLWTQLSAVGWMHSSTPIEITVDLGQEESISGASLRTAAGVAGVYWAESIDILVSDDNTNYYYAGSLWELNGLGPANPASSYQIYTFQTENLKTRGRYVRFRIVADGSYRFFFCDEIEIYQGPDECLDLERAGEDSSFFNAVNLAAGKSYSFNRSPNYSVCTDSGDTTQLTDGNIYNGNGQLWLQTSTVGWGFSWDPAEITVDLGNVYPVSGVLFRGAACNSNGVYWPGRIDLMISSNGTDYYYLGNLKDLMVNKLPDVTTEYYNFSCIANSLITKGRYIKFQAHPVDAYGFIFCDEIKVFKGPNEYLQVNSSGSDILPSELENLALGKTYSFSTSPNYSPCTDSGDTTQLTDGNIYEGENQFWLQASTVGWMYKPDPNITVDMGSIKPVAGAAIRMAAGSSGVTWPKSIQLQVSLDNSTYYYAGDLIDIAESLPDAEKYATHLYRTMDLKTKARYFRFKIVNSGYYTFCDEIEIYKGPDSLLNLQTIGEDLSVFNAVDADVRQTQLSSRTRFRYDIDKLRRRVRDAVIPASTKVGIVNSLETCKGQVASWTLQDDPDTFVPIPPYDTLHQNILALNSTILQAEGMSGIVCWHKYRYDHLDYLEKPDTSSASVIVRMMQDEKRSDVLNLTNTGSSTSTVTFYIQNLPNGTNPSYLDVYHAEPVDTREGVVRVCPLIPIDPVSGYYSITIPAGMTKQLWFTVDSSSLSTGQYTGQIVLSGIGNIPFYLNISSITLNSSLSPKGLLFDYVVNEGYAVTSQNKTAAIQMLGDFMINVPSGNRSTAAMPSSSQVDSSGNLTSPVDFSVFDDMITRFPNAEKYYIFLYVTEASPTLGGKSPGTAAFNTLMQQWCAAWDSHIQSKGLSAGKVVFNILDEPQTTSQYDLLIQWTSAIKQNSSMIHIWSDPLNVENSSITTKVSSLLNYIDIVCPGRALYENYSQTTKNMFASFRAQTGKEQWFYMCAGPTRHFDPSYYRMQPWHAVEYGCKGSAFWAFADNGNVDSWNDYLVSGNAKSSFAAAFWDTSTVTETKQMHAVREGILDYIYLMMLKNASGEQAAVNKADTAITRARDAAGTFYYSSTWRTKEITRAADITRLEILDILEP